MIKIILTGFVVILLPVLAFTQSNEGELLIKGRVLDHEGRPVAGALVSAGPVGPLKGRVPMATSDAQGEFSVVVHQTGQFNVTAQKAKDGYANTANNFYYPYPATSSMATVIPGQPAPTVTVQFGPKAGKLELLLVDADTRGAVKMAMISLCRIERPKYCHRVISNPVTRNPDPLPVPAAPFTMEISAPGYQTAYGETSRELGLQPLQIFSGTVKQLKVYMHRGTDTGPANLPAPKIVSPADRTVLLNVAPPRMLTVEWSAVPGAATYTVEVDVCEWEQPDGGECRKGTSPLALWRQQPPPTGIEATKYEFLFPGTQPGRWRVWAVDAEGRPGDKSPWTLFIYR